MNRNKPRIQLALYDRPKHHDVPHQALFVAPKDGKGPTTKHHVKNTLQVDHSGKASQPWRYESTTMSDVEAEQRLLVRVIIAKVTKSRADVEKILEGVPVYQVDDPDKAKAESFDCRSWVRYALHELKRQGAITSTFDEWEDVEKKALEYLNLKRQQERWDRNWDGGSDIPLMDLLEEKELVK